MPKETDMVPNLDKRGILDISCVVNGPIQTNTYFACSGGECIVIDPAWEGERLLEEFRRTHPTERITALVCTHGHADHIGGVAGMRRALGDDVPFLLPAGDVGFMAGAIASMKRMWGFDFEMPPAPDRLLREGDVVEVGEATLQVIETPGHTPGGAVLFCAAESGNVAFVGDTLFPGAHGRTDLEGGDQAQIVRSLGKLGHLLPPDTLCCIGHDGTTTIADELRANPFMQRGLRQWE